MSHLAQGDEDLPRDFAVVVVEALRGAGFDALWAGGCVRDDLLGLAPKDYDVATNATPDQVIELFGKRKTVPVGVSFGVVMVLGPTRGHGQIEVATFRADGEYLDGRRPSAVSFCSAEEDARRRDFTINGMFYDPLADEVIDYVGGRSDLNSGIVRAIGNATARFTEDKLRMLRAVRFAATYEFEIENSTASAIAALRGDVTQVSAERIAQELRRMLSHRTRAVSVTQLQATGLMEVLFPKLFGSEALVQVAGAYFTSVSDVLRHLTLPVFEPALAVLLNAAVREDGHGVRRRTGLLLDECRSLRLSNEESECICWLADNVVVCRNARQLPLHIIKPILYDQRRELLLEMLQALSKGLKQDPDDVTFLNRYLEDATSEDLNPKPFVDGADLKKLDIPTGPIFKQLLTTIRNEQLDEQLLTREQALKRLQELYRE